MKPKFIFSAVFAVSFILAVLLPHLGARAVAPGTAASAVIAPAAASMQIAGQSVAPVQAPALPAPQIQALPQSAPSVQVQSDIPAEKIPLTSSQSLPDLAAFAASVENQQAGVLVGVYAPGVFALPVVQQPNGNNDYVSTEAGILTQYGAASNYGSIGILAHNYLSGAEFFNLTAGREVILIYGDGHLSRYKITQIAKFQALSPEDPYSNFVDLSDPSRAVQPFTQVFSRFYSTPGQVVFQTCIDANGNPSWGRIFIVGQPE